MIFGQRTAAAALLISVFLAGALGGAVVTKLLDRRAWQERAEEMGLFERRGGKPLSMGRADGGFPDRGLAPMWVSDRLATVLNLSEEQKGQVQSILEGRADRADAKIAEMMPGLRAELDSMYLEVRAILTSDQQGLFDEFRAREEERMFRRGPGAWPGGPS